MASQAEIEMMYDWVDKIHTLRLGEFADFTCAYFNGDFSKTLDQAQRDKHNWIFDGTNTPVEDFRVLDVGCGWGPILNAVRKRGGKGIGLTLSSAQAKYGARKGLDVRLQDYKTVNGAELGVFDSVISVGAFEHFCSEQEYLAGKQMDIYRSFFKFCSERLPQNGRLFLQTMTWGKKVPNSAEVRLDAPAGSDELALARLREFYPGSWLPANLGQIVEAASPYFNFQSSSNGRLDYIETLKRWAESSRNLLKPENILPTLRTAAELAVRYTHDKNFRTQVSAVYHGDQTTVFRREIFSHERMFFEKK
jgi:cyclopropane-fatty-acyl-phospholipid synthase